MKGIVTAGLFFIFGIATAIAALVTPVYAGPSNDRGHVFAFMKMCSGDGYTDDCHNFDYYMFDSSQTKIFSAYCAVLAIYFVVAVVGIIISVLERRRHTRRAHIVVVFFGQSVVAFVAWVMMVANFHGSRVIRSPYSDKSWSDYGWTLSASPALMITAWLASALCIVPAWCVKGREDEAGYSQLGVAGYGYGYGAAAPGTYGMPPTYYSQPLAAPPSAVAAADTTPAPPGFVWTTTTTRHLVPVPTPPTTVAN